MKMLPRNRGLLRHKRFAYSLLALAMAWLCILAAPHPAIVLATTLAETEVAQIPTPATAAPTTAQQWERQGQTFYQQGQYAEAVQALQQAVQSYVTTGDTIGQAVALSNLALTYQQLGDWAEATDAIDRAVNLLPANSALEAGDRLPVLAQALDVRGKLQLAQGQAEAALATWEQATALHQQTGNQSGVARGQINQAQALQTLGLYRRAIALLRDLNQNLQAQPDSLEKAASLRSLGDALLIAGSSDDAEVALQQSLTVAEAIQSPAAIAAAHLSLGNLFRSNALTQQRLGNLEIAQTATSNALSAYQQAATSPNAEVQTEAQINHLRFLVELGRWADAQALYPEIQQQIDRLSPGRNAIYAQVHLAQSLMRLRRGDPQNRSLPDLSAIAAMLNNALQQAETLGDDRARSFALGNLGNLYEQANQRAEAQNLTEQALVLANAIQATDIAYRWEWQLGRLLNANHNSNGAIEAYAQAFDTLQSLRRDLVALNPDAQFTFRESAEPIYRQFVDLLLRSPEQGNLVKARQVMESLQIAELENFFQQGCLGSTLQIDQVVDQPTSAAAVIYSIILPDRLEVIVKLPGEQALYHAPPIPITQLELKTHLHQLLLDLQEAYTYEAVKTGSKRVYDWLVAPVRSQLEQKQIKTLVFVLDGALRGIPMSALYDGNAYLIENYAVSTVLGLDIRNPKALPERDRIKVLAGSVSKPPADRQEFSNLENVTPEVESISQSGLRTTLLIDFTRDQFSDTLDQGTFEIVHLATHGQFSSDRNNTFLLAADNIVTVDELGQIFRDRDTSAAAIELLILSACETASGDDRAVLGIAGTAVRAGARSAIASVWSLDDASGVTFAQELYKHLGEPNVTRAEALRLAQQTLARNPEFQHPRYWAPYVLIGSWL